MGCASYTAFIADVCAETLLSDELPWTALGWNRKLDDTSDAYVEMLGVGRSASAGNGACENCCSLIDGIRPWCHSLVIFRRDKNGGLTRVWDGPITEIRSAEEDGFGIFIEAKDLSAFWSKRFIHNDHFFGEYPDGLDIDLPAVDDVADIFEAIVLDAMTPNEPCMRLHGGPIGDLIKRKFEANEYETVMDAIQSLSDGTFDWTVIGRDVYFGSALEDIDFICDNVSLHDDDFINTPPIKIDGLEEANRIYVEGDFSEYGESLDDFGGINPVFGETQQDDCVLLEKYVRDDDIDDIAEAQIRAEEEYDQFGGPVSSITGGKLDPGANVIANMLPPVGCDEAPLMIPGMDINVSIQNSCLTVSGTYELTEVDVKVEVSEDDGIDEEYGLGLKRPNG